VRAFLLLDGRITKVLMFVIIHSARGRNVYVQFSSHQELITSDMSSMQSRKLSSEQQVCVYFSPFTPSPFSSFLFSLSHLSSFLFPLTSFSSLSWGSGCAHVCVCFVPLGGGRQDSQPNRILLITIHNPLYPITADVLHQVFSSYGVIEKIVTFQKSAG
jgi:polypyrimidine tract-binding protein 2